MKRVDLHLHTKKCKAGEGVTRTIDVDDFIEIISKNMVGVCAITNHNTFDLDEYNAILGKNPEFIIFPGIELDVEFNADKIKHIIIVCNPNCRTQFQEVFSNDKNRNCDTYKITYSDFIKSIKQFSVDEIMVIPHFLDKDKNRALSIEEKTILKNDLSQYVVILETSKLQSMGIVNAHDEVSLIGSDVKNWKNYETDAQVLPELKFQIDSFGKFYELASDSKQFIKTALNGCRKYAIPIGANGEEIEVYDDINVIFGEKGSGKTQLLKMSIYPELEKLGKRVFLHEGKDYQRSYDEMIDSIVSSVTIDSAKKREIIRSLHSILEYRENTYDNFILKYLMYHESETKNVKARYIKKTEASYNKSIPETILEIVQGAEDKVARICKTEELNNQRGDDNPHKHMLKKELSILKDELKEKAVSRCCEKYVSDKTNSLLKDIKGILEKKVGKKSKPNNIGLSKMVSERLRIATLHKRIVDNFEDLKSSRVVRLGELPNKGVISVEVSVRVLSKEEKHSKGSPFERNRIQDNRRFIEKLTTLSARKLSGINEYFSSDERSRTADDYFEDCVKKACRIIKEDGKTYEPSEGEKSILSISGVIENTSYDCYLFDEIERGLGNKYISEYLIPGVKSLRDRGKLIVVSTHNANIAISTLPSQTIYCNYLGDADADIYFTGNMYSNELVSIKNGEVVKDWEEKALKHLEGSKEMFSVRRNIWKLKK